MLDSKQNRPSTTSSANRDKGGFKRLIEERLRRFAAMLNQRFSRLSLNAQRLLWLLIILLLLIAYLRILLGAVKSGDILQ